LAQLGRDRASWERRGMARVASGWVGRVVRCGEVRPGEVSNGVAWQAWEWFGSV